MRVRKILRRRQLRTQTERGKLQCGDAMPVGFLCPGGMLWERVHGCVHGLQSRWNPGYLYGRRRQVPGSTEALHDVPVHHVRHVGDVPGRQVRLLRQGLQLQSRVLCRRVLSYESLDLRWSWGMCCRGSRRVYQSGVFRGHLPRRMRTRPSAVQQQRCPDLHGRGCLGNLGPLSKPGLRWRRLYRHLRARERSVFGQRRPDLWRRWKVGKHRLCVLEPDLHRGCLYGRLCTQYQAVFGQYCAVM
jgi:hypothetical protein